MCQNFFDSQIKLAALAPKIGYWSTLQDILMFNTSFSRNSTTLNRCRKLFGLYRMTLVEYIIF